MFIAMYPLHDSLESVCYNIIKSSAQKTGYDRLRRAFFKHRQTFLDRPVMDGDIQHHDAVCVRYHAGERDTVARDADALRLFRWNVPI